MIFPDRRVVECLRQKYPSGTKVELVSVDDPYRKLPPGLIGTVDCVDDAGTIHVNWENGCRLGIAYGVDFCRRVSQCVDKKQ